MIDRRSGPDWFAHAVLWTGILVMAFPVYLTFIASTHEPSTIANGQMPLVPGDKLLETYWQTIFVGPTRTSRMPVGAMIEELPIISQPSSTPHLAMPTIQVAFW